MEKEGKDQVRSTRESITRSAVKENEGRAKAGQKPIPQEKLERTYRDAVVNNEKRKQG